ncbi:claudin-15-like [Scyliorhinus canicula]|uniref:claudin-15-like n=1 Tax=Scyliorhinus canicula TaxID=7830 RepID=UPI0018F6E673|nr:claudin-15-like [Scyliorhinus canicula]
MSRIPGGSRRSSGTNVKICRGGRIAKRKEKTVALPKSEKEEAEIRSETVNPTLTCKVPVDEKALEALEVVITIGLGGKICKRAKRLEKKTANECLAEIQIQRQARVGFIFRCLLTVFVSGNPEAAETGQQQSWCKHGGSELTSGISGLPAPDYVRASQALMIISILMGFIAGCVTLFGLRCTLLGNTDPIVKAKIATAGGALFIVAALCAMVPVSWYAYNVTIQFYDTFYPGTKYELGPGLYIGWAGGSLELIGGICLCLSCKAARGATGQYTYTYRASRSTPGAGTVSRKLTSEVDNASNYGKNAYV